MHKLCLTNRLIDCCKCSTSSCRLWLIYRFWSSLLAYKLHTHIAIYNVSVNLNMIHLVLCIIFCSLFCCKLSVWCIFTLEIIYFVKLVFFLCWLCSVCTCMKQKVKVKVRFKKKIFLLLGSLDKSTWSLISQVEKHFSPWRLV